MTNAIFEGVIMGLVLSALIGPVFFQIIDLSISKNKAAALIFAVGVWLSDVSVLSICSFLVKQIQEWHLLESKILEYTAFLVFVIFGLSKLLAKPAVEAEINIKPNNRTLFSEGLIINSVNPSVWAFWLSTSTLAQELFNGDKISITVYFIACILTFIGVDVLKIILANKLKNRINNNVLFIFNKIVGVIFIFAGLFILYKSL
jgi:threonine/homoserine/homoserine lactone efflux protein